MGARWTAVLFPLAMLAAPGPAGAQDSGKTIQQELAEQLDLFSLCSPGEGVDVLVDDVPEHAARTGLTADAIREVVEVRLRRARLLDPNADPLVHVEIVLGEPEEGISRSTRSSSATSVTLWRNDSALRPSPRRGPPAEQGRATPPRSWTTSGPSSTRSSPNTSASATARRAWRQAGPAPRTPIPKPEAEPQTRLSPLQEPGTVRVRVDLPHPFGPATTKRVGTAGNADQSGQDVPSPGHLSTRSPCLVRAM